MEHILEAEKFKLVQELVAIQDNITNARNGLTAIQKQTNDYIIAREEEARGRVNKVLEASKDALEETRKNHEELSAYRQELKQFADSISQATILLTDISGSFRKDLDVAEAMMASRYDEMQEILKNARIERVAIEEDRKQLKRESYRIQEETRLLADRRGVLERGFAELKRLQQKTT